MFTGAGTGPPETTPTTATITTFSTRLPIHAGDYIGGNWSAGVFLYATGTSETGATQIEFSPALADGGPAAAPCTTSPSCSRTDDEPLINADVGALPSSSVAVSACSKTATIPVPEGSHTLECWGEDTVGGLESPHPSATVLVAATYSGSGLATDPSGPDELFPTSVPGTFTVTRTAIDRCGNSTSASFTYTVGLATVSALAIHPKSFLAASHGGSIATATGTQISYTDTQPAITTFTVQRPAPGVMHDGKCVKPSRALHKGKPCTRYLAVGGFHHHDVAGKKRFRFTGRVKGRKLSPGRYRLRAVARGPGGQPGPPAFTNFRILPG
jgi:hypothetical protein